MPPAAAAYLAGPMAPSFGLTEGGGADREALRVCAGRRSYKRACRVACPRGPPNRPCRFPPPLGAACPPGGPPSLALRVPHARDLPSGYPPPPGISWRPPCPRRDALRANL